MHPGEVDAFSKKLSLGRVTPISLRILFGLQIGKYSWQHRQPRNPQIWALNQDFIENRPDMAVLRSSKQLLSVWNTCQMLLLQGNPCVRCMRWLNIIVALPGHFDKPPSQNIAILQL